MLRAYGSQYTTTPDGAELWYATFGEGELTCILCDGLGCDGFAWKYLAPALAKQHRVLRFHYRGHGKSSMPRDPTRIGVGFAADDLAQVMNEAGIQRGVLFGHSMGVQVTLEMHRRHPERVSGLVPICGSYGHALDTFHDDTVARRFFPLIRELVERFPETANKLWKAVVPTELGIFTGRYGESNPQLLSREDFWPYLVHLGNMDPRAFAGTLASAAEHSAWEHLPNVHVPTLVIAGERDRFTPMWLSERMSSAIPAAELMVIPTASHCAPLEMPQLVELRVERFLRDRVLPGLRPPAPTPRAG